MPGAGERRERGLELGDDRALRQRAGAQHTPERVERLRSEARIGQTKHAHRAGAAIAALAAYQSTVRARPSRNPTRGA